MKKRILLSLVSFFAMTAMWASITDAYQIHVTAAANGTVGGTAELTLNMKNRNAIGTWVCDLVLPEGVTFEEITVVEGRYPAEYGTPQITAVDKGDGIVTITCEGEEGVALTGTDGAVATVTVKIGADVKPGNYTVTVENAKLIEVNGTIHDKKTFEFPWTIEEGAAPGIKGDVNDDGNVDIADAVEVLNVMAGQQTNPKADVNDDGTVDIADLVEILNIMAGN
ncbi:MAG: dockerin type I repeat-containing protein [Prevotellaceae bacterium]|nr:dockerin type I repeat-containing protein [Prevotellaceae bacterium]